MSFLSKIGIQTCALALMVAALPLGFSARWDKKTNLTVHETIEVPGATLAPGEYVVKLVDSDSNRHIVRFMNKEETEVLTTVIAIPNQRLQPTGDTTFTFYETPAGQAPALRAWFYPGDNFGQEFAYPEGRAQQLSQATNMQVPSVPENTQAAATEPAQEAPPAPVREPAPAPAPAPVERPRQRVEEPTTLAQAQPPAARPAPQQRSEPAPAPQPEMQRDRLPDTATPAPMFVLIGFASFAAAFAVRKASRFNR